MFHPTLGRWLQEDPIGFDAGDANLYRAEENSPTNLLDPYGLETWSVKHGKRITLGSLGVVGDLASAV